MMIALDFDVLALSLPLSLHSPAACWRRHCVLLRRASPPLPCANPYQHTCLLHHLHLHLHLLHFHLLPARRALRSCLRPHKAVPCATVKQARHAVDRWQGQTSRRQPRLRRRQLSPESHATHASCTASSSPLSQPSALLAVCARTSLHLSLPESAAACLN